MSENKDQNKSTRIVDEHYDGIVEHDHPLPNWWIAIFVITIVFAIFYYGYYEVLGGPSTDQELSEKLAAIKASAPEESSDNAFANLDELIKDSKMVETGKKIFSEKCFMCHGDKGQGLIGPNLTDNFWIHGGKPSEILHTIQKGVPDKGMVPWESVLSADEQIAAVAFIKSIHGTNPAGGKAPEGTEYKD